MRGPVGQCAAVAQPCGLCTRSDDAGKRASFSAGRRGRATSSPPQLGQRPPSLVPAQSAQKVHSNEQMRAFVASGGKSRLQHSQLGRSWSMVRWERFGLNVGSRSSIVPPGRVSSTSAHLALSGIRSAVAASQPLHELGNHLGRRCRLRLQQAVRALQFHLLRAGKAAREGS